VPIRGRVGAGLADCVSSYDGYCEETGTPMLRREGPGRDVVVIISFGEDWVIDGRRLPSFVASSQPPSDDVP
jgi:hypothetical protein